MFQDGEVVHADDRTFAEKVLGQAGPVLVGFLASWCSPCRSMPALLDRLARELGPRLQVVLMDADEARDAAARLGVEGVPTCLLLREGRVAARIAGVQPYPVLKERVQVHLA